MCSRQAITQIQQQWPSSVFARSSHRSIYPSRGNKITLYKAYLSWPGQVLLKKGLTYRTPFLWKFEIYYFLINENYLISVIHYIFAWQLCHWLHSAHPVKAPLKASALIYALCGSIFQLLYSFIIIGSLWYTYRIQLNLSYCQSFLSFPNEAFLNNGHQLAINKWARDETLRDDSDYMQSCGLQQRGRRGDLLNTLRSAWKSHGSGSHRFLIIYSS